MLISDLHGFSVTGHPIGRPGLFFWWSPYPASALECVGTAPAGAINVLTPDRPPHSFRSEIGRLSLRLAELSLFLSVEWWFCYS